jgi:hypothetical protein
MVRRLLSANPVNEDKQTASVFSTLLHLPDEEFWNILRDSCYENTKKKKKKAGHIKKYVFWPPWEPGPTDKIHTNNVIPDLFIRFENIDLIIEAKKKDEYQQYQEQLESEYLAYKKKYGANKEAAIIAVGGLYPFSISSENKKITIHKCRWRGLLDTLYQYLQKHEKYQTNNIRIVNDCIAYLEYFGFRKIEWLKDMSGTFLNICNHDTILDWLKPVNITVIDLNNFEETYLNIKTNSIECCLQWRIL